MYIHAYIFLNIGLCKTTKKSKVKYIFTSTHTDTQRYTQTHTDTHTETDTDTDTYTHTHRHTQSHTMSFKNDASVFVESDYIHRWFKDNYNLILCT